MRLAGRIFGGMAGRVFAVIFVASGLTGVIVGVAAYLVAGTSLDHTGVILVAIALELAVLLAAAIFSRRLGRPLVALRRGAELLGLGDLGYRIDINAAEELQSLARSFNRMAEAIQSSHEMMEQSVGERTKELQIINEMVTSLRRTMSPHEILQKAMTLFMELIAYDIGWCYLMGEGGWRILYSRLPDGYDEHLPGFISPGEGTLGRIMEEGKPVFVANVEEAVGMEPVDFHLGKSFAALPLRTTSRILGLICLASTKVVRLSKDVKEALQVMADEVGIALENAVLDSELQNHINELERVNRELLGLDEMKSNFISAVTHEFKQPLALISGYTQTIYDYYESLTYEEEMHCLRVIMERTQFLAGLVEDLLDISMLEMGRIRLQFEELDLPALAAKEAEQYDTGEGGIRIALDFPADFPTVTADARRMDQVLSNLLSNAVKFSMGRGKIMVTGMVKGDRVRVRVEDRGVGIDPSQLEKIFDRFFQADATTRRPYPGVGLGLFICRQLIEAHNGRIWAENRPEGGSTFNFEIPLEQEKRR